MIPYLNPIAGAFAIKHNVDVVDVHILITKVLEKVIADNYKIPSTEISPPNDWLSTLTDDAYKG